MFRNLTPLRKVNYMFKGHIFILDLPLHYARLTFIIISIFIAYIYHKYIYKSIYYIDCLYLLLYMYI